MPSKVPFTPLVFAAVIGVAVVAAALATGAAGRRRLAIVLTLPGWLSGLLLPLDQPIARAMVSFTALMMTMKVTDLARDRTARALPDRVGYLFSAFELRTLRRVPARLDRALAVKALFTGLILALCTWVEVVAPREGASLVLRWGAGVLFFYALLDFFDGFFRALFLCAGFATPPLQDAPILSLTVREFWGKRWNLLVGGWLSRHLFRPLARRRLPGAGALLAFAFSGLIHAWPTVVGVGLLDGALMLSFFLAQTVLVHLETRLGVDRWSVPAARTWVIGAMLLTSPLFVVPGLAVIGLR